MESDGGFHLLALEAPNYLLIAHAAVLQESSPVISAAL